MNAKLRDPNHHLAGPFLPQTPLDSRSPSPAPPARTSPSPVSPYFRWAVQPLAAAKVLVIPVVLAANWALLAPFLAPDAPNPFTPFFLLAGRIPSSPSHDPRYAKTYYDLFFIAYHIVFFSLLRQLITVYLCRRLARYFRIKRPAKIDRFGEQSYAFVYFLIFGTWGFRIMRQLPTNWYRTEYFWIDYPHWDMKPELKRYYLMQTAYWCQQLIVLVLGLEKPRKDYVELVAHHLVTLWLVGWSYLVNLTFIGNAVFVSMDIPDTFLAISKSLNYIQWHNSKIVSFIVFIGIWTYFRHFLNLRILWSVWYEIHLIPKTAKVWSWKNGTYFPNWMTYQVFIPLVLLQLLNLFWYYFMLRILVRAFYSVKIRDERSDDEDDGTPEGNGDTKDKED